MTSSETSPLNPLGLSSSSADLPKAPAAIPGGFWIRFIANLIDGLIQGVIYIPLSLLVAWIISLFTGQSASLSMGGESGGFMFIFQIVNFVFELVVICVYYGYFYPKKGTTPGKKIFKLMVVDSQSGAYLTIGQAIYRELWGKFISMLLLGIGFIMAGVRKDKRALHDLMARSQVIQTG